jgi:hypothetical protein
MLSDVDALFTLPLAEFTAARNALAARLKKEGRKDDSARVKGMVKPPATAWAVNQLYWQQPQDIERLLAVGEKIKKAQTGKPGDLRGLLEERRALVRELTGCAEAILLEAGHAASPDATRRVSISLETLAALGRQGGERAGRLTSDLEPLGFDGLAALLGGKPLEPAKILQFRRATQEKKSAEDVAEARAKAQEAVKAAEKALQLATRDAGRADAAVAKANARVETLEEQRRELDARLKSAQEEAHSAASEAKKRQQSLAEAQRALEKARAALP